MKKKNLPVEFQNEIVNSYFKLLQKKRLTFFIKRVFDIFASILLIIILFPVMFLIALLIKVTSKGPIMYKQKRVTKNLKLFNIYKFRTMIVNADITGPQITALNDSRITKIGKFLRKTRLDELPQLFNVLIGDMSFVGPRPEVLRYVNHYTDEMYATLLVRAGITCTSSIMFKNEDELISNNVDVDEVYINTILPEKMKYNFEYLKNLSFFKDLWILIRTII